MVEVLYDVSIGSVGIPLNEGQIGAAIDAAEMMGVTRIAIKEFPDCDDGLNCAVSFPYSGNNVKKYENYLWGLQAEYKRANTTKVKMPSLT